MSDSAQTISVFIVGLGVHGTSTAKLLPGFGVEILAAADPIKAGQDLGALTGNEALAGIVIDNDIDDLPWDQHTPDVLIITAAVEMDELQELSLKAFERGSNVLTIVGDSFAMQDAFPAHYEVINQAGIKAGKSFVSTGGADVLWAGLVIHLTSQMRELSSINLYTHIGVDGYPEDFLKWCGIGIEHDEFEATTEEMAKTPSVFGGVLPLIARKLGLDVEQETRTFKMFTLDEPVWSETYQREISAGEPYGTHDFVQLTTHQGITLRAELVTTGVNGKDEYIARLHGVPEAELRHHLEPQHLSTEGATISRIVDVITARPGVVSTADLPTPHFRGKLLKP